MEQQKQGLQLIEAQKQELQKQIEESEKEIATLWNGLFHAKETKTMSPTQRFLSLASSSAGLIDGAILGWKLYRRFKK